MSVLGALARVRERPQVYLRIIANTISTGSLLETLKSRFPFRMPDPRFPRIVALEFTNVCNLRCPYCASQTGPVRGQRGFMTDATFARVASQLREFPLQTLRVIGGGEPTMHPRFAEFAVQLRGAARISTLTNAAQTSSMLTETISSSQGKLGPRTGRPWAVRILRGILRRLARPTHVMVLQAACNDFGPACPEGCALARVTVTASSADRYLAEEAMRAAGEPTGLVAPRLAHGDEFFGWLVDGRVVSFGWVTFQDRTVGPFQLAEGSGRVFLYNFHTLEAYRGRRFYPALLLAMRHILGREKVTEFVIDVDVRNAASARGIEKGGFVLVARVTFLTLFARWRCLGRRTVLDRKASSLFRAA